MFDTYSTIVMTLQYQYYAITQYWRIFPYTSYYSIQYMIHPTFHNTHQRAAPSIDLVSWVLCVCSMQGMQFDHDITISSSSLLVVHIIPPRVPSTVLVLLYKCIGTICMRHISYFITLDPSAMVLVEGEREHRHKQSS